MSHGEVGGSTNWVRFVSVGMKGGGLGGKGQR